MQRQKSRLVACGRRGHQPAFPEIQSDDPRCRQVEQLLTGSGRALGLSLCFHDRTHHLCIRRALKIHRARFCLGIKRHHHSTCIAFDAEITHQELSDKPGGRIQTCPFGVTEIAVPVFAGGVYAGVLFAGPCWTSSAPVPDTSLVIPPSRFWLADRLLLVRGVAKELAVLLGDQDTHERRSDRMLQYLREHLSDTIYLADLAKHLARSPSRVRHLVKEQFGVRFATLVQSMKLQEAGRWLRTTDMTVSEAAARVGIDDPNYFSRIFRRATGLTPRVYRRRNRIMP